MRSFKSVADPACLSTVPPCLSRVTHFLSLVPLPDITLLSLCFTHNSPHMTTCQSSLVTSGSVHNALGCAALLVEPRIGLRALRILNPRALYLLVLPRGSHPRDLEERPIWAFTHYPSGQWLARSYYHFLNCTTGDLGCCCQTKMIQSFNLCLSCIPLSRSSFYKLCVISRATSLPAADWNGPLYWPVHLFR